MLKGFREFISKGNVVDLAVGVVIGGAFTLVVTAFTNNVLMAAIAAIFGKPSFDDFGLDLGDRGQIQYGVFPTALVNFLLVSAAIYFLVVMPINKLRERKDKPEEEQSNEERIIELLEQIAAK